ncbi:MAG TPA: SGNH/GDSL hydrolase family protein, partial [Clostridia bacterium]|nr:SGNH/GDSL hydrolase family protein [Clostridia bacterium]
GHCALLARFLDADFVNLGFSGNAKGEPEMARYIAGMEMSAFVLDYDHNTPNPEHLERTHGPFYDIVRQAQPDLPIVLVSSPNSDTLKEGTQRRAVIRATYDRALAQGDRKVYYVPGDALLGRDHRECCRVDGTHPNDLGFMRMAETILPALAAALESPRE